MDERQTYCRAVTVDASARSVFYWHTQDGAIQRLLPPWQRVKVLMKEPGLEPGTQAFLQLAWGPFKLDWIAEHSELINGQQFTDIQIAGPFERWKHQHHFTQIETDRSVVQETIEYTLPGGKWGAILAGAWMKREIEQLVAYRLDTIANDLGCIHHFPNTPSLRILVSGSNGLVGNALLPFLQAAGHRIHRLVRHTPTHPTDIVWDPATGSIEAGRLENFDAVIHLAGENIASGRWTEKKKAALRSSRVDGTRLLVKALSALLYPPKVLISASAIGFYGDRGNEFMTESSGKGKGFLSDLCAEWEAAAGEFNAGRTVLTRFGIILSPQGGALKQMLTPFRLGVGGVVGSGEQYYSWIGIDDVVYHLYRALLDHNLCGPINIVSPNAVTNRQFTKVLGKVLKRPTLCPLPAAVARLALGEMADALLLCSARVVPQTLATQGYTCAYPDLEECLRHLLGRVTSWS